MIKNLLVAATLLIAVPVQAADSPITDSPITDSPITDSPNVDTPIADVLETPPAAAEAALLSEVTAEVRTGSLIFSEGDCLAVRMYTRSPFTHVAAVVMTDDGPVVYDSMNGIGVRVQPLDAYIESERPNILHVVHPSEPFTAAETKTFVDALDGQLGREYGIVHHLTGKRADGIHCSEYVADALLACNRIRANTPPRVSPATLYYGLTFGRSYSDPTTIELSGFLVEQPTEDLNWCQRSWLATKNCTWLCCSKVKGWFVCK